MSLETSSLLADSAALLWLSLFSCYSWLLTDHDMQRGLALECVRQEPAARSLQLNYKHQFQSGSPLDSLGLKNT